MVKLHSTCFYDNDIEVACKVLQRFNNSLQGYSIEDIRSRVQSLANEYEFTQGATYVSTLGVTLSFYDNEDGQRCANVSLAAHLFFELVD